MSKYIIDLRPDCKVVQQICAIDKGINIGSRSIGLLDELTDDYVKKNFKDLLEGEYQRGLDDAWEAAKKIANMWTRIGNNELLAIFGITERIGHSTIRALFEKQTANEAMLELEAYEEKQDNKFEFGDEITNSYGTKGCVVSKDNEEGEMIYALFDGYRVPQHVAKSKYRKTGKHYDIEKILEAMKHD